jgi:hypothetical protein
LARTEVKSNRKFHRLVRALDLPEPYVLGLLEWMWHSAYENGTDFLGDCEDVEMLAKWPGEQGVFCRALSEIGWLDENDGRYFVHDLDHHAPEYVKKKLRRKNGVSDSKIGTNGGCLPNPTQPNQDPTQEAVSFNAFWQAWPSSKRKVNRDACWRCWQSGNLHSQAEQIMRSLNAWKASKDWQKEDGQYVPLPKTWLNQSRWEAPDPTPAKPSHDPEDLAATIRKPITPAMRALAYADDPVQEVSNA